MIIIGISHLSRLALKWAVSILSIYGTAFRGNSATCRRAAEAAFVSTILCLLCAIPLLAQASDPIYPVTQKGQQFNPRVLSIQRGDTLQVFNDDGELIHHAYVDSKTFSFDSGDQEPGSKTDIVFSVPGTFVVLCGIHPKMRLDVTVK